MASRFRADPHPAGYAGFAQMLGFTGAMVGGVKAPNSPMLAALLAR
jgi:hypothetical protein